VKTLELLAISAVTLGAVSTTARADYCTSGSDFWNASVPIPVVLNANIAADLCPGATCGSFANIGRTANPPLSEGYQGSGGRLRFAYQGATTAAAGDTVSGKIHIYAMPCSGGTLGVTVQNGSGSPPFARIRMCQSAAGTWNSFLPEPGRISFQAVLLHELGHAINLDHSEDCHAVGMDNSIMTAYYQEGGSANLQYPELDFINDHYGPRSETVSRRSSSDALTWTELTNSAPASFAAVRGRLAATNTSAGGTDVVVGYLTDDGAAPIVRIRRLTSAGVWSTLRDLVTVSTYPPGVAKRSNSIIYVTYQYIDSLFDHRQRVYATKTLDGGATWSANTELTTSTTRTRNAGVASAYDPGTTQFITVWRASDNTINYRIEGGSGPYTLTNPATGVALKSSDTPSIACGSVSVVGAENCLIMWTNPSSWSRTSLWTQGHLSGDQLVIPAANVVRTHGFSTVGAPRVAYNYSAAAPTTLPWHVVLNQGGQTSYTWRKGGSYASTWSDQRSFSESPKPGLPAAAAGGGSRLVLVTDE